jgi:HK97 family phage major capsid protein
VSKVKQTEEKMAREVAQAQAILALAEKENRDLSDEEKKETDEIAARVDALRVDKDRYARIENMASQILHATNSAPNAGTEPRIVIPANARRHKALKAFKNAEDAYAAGRFLQATMSQDDDVKAAARQWCRDNGIIQNAHSTTTNTEGGYLVPERFEMAIINLKEEFGVARQNARVYPMAGPVDHAPKRLSGLTMYYVGENSTGTESQASFGQVRLDAKKGMILTLLSNELNSDSVISMADFVAEEMAYAFAVGEDNAVFNGDGTSTYGGIVGLKNALAAGSLATGAAGDNTFAELEWAFFEAAIGALPRFPGLQPKWYVHSSFYATAMLRLMNAAGGNTYSTIEQGAMATPMFLGYPVVFTQCLSSGGSTDYASTIVGYFGDLRLVGTLGDLQGISIRSDASRYFEKDQLAVRGTQRWDWVVHERGTASAAGPMIGLKMGTA